jgi:hypothetical protein
MESNSDKIERTHLKEQQLSAAGTSLKKDLLKTVKNNNRTKDKPLYNKKLTTKSKTPYLIRSGNQNLQLL